MFILIPALLSLVVAIVRGGRLIRLAQVPFRHAWVVSFSLALQVIMFTPLWHALGGGERWIPPLYILSMLALTAWFALNFRLPGMAVIGLGQILNLLVILSNGGRMPASPAALERSGWISRFTAPGQTVYNNLTIATEETRLYFLGDIFAIPKEIPLANVFSAGDVLIALGAMYFLQRVLTDEGLDPPVADD
ncbi:MAG: DUF5317 domain-containing protein [Anaerolineae bacterium]